VYPATMAARLLGQVLISDVEHLQDFVPWARTFAIDRAATCPDSCPSPLCSVSDEGLGVEHVRRAYSPPIELR